MTYVSLNNSHNKQQKLHLFSIITLVISSLAFVTVFSTVYYSLPYCENDVNCDRWYSLKHASPLSEEKPNDIEKVISCYYNTPMRSIEKQLMPSGINPHLCTHINVAFASVSQNKILINELQKEAIYEVNKLKLVNPNLRILLSVGGSGEQGFSDMVVNHTTRKIFIKSIKETLRNLKLDGIDLDWEFPAVHDHEPVGHKRERQHFSQLLREIRMEYNREKRNYLLTVAAAAQQTIIDTAYDVDQMNEYTDFVNVMTYDFHFFNRITPFTGLNSPLYPREEEKLFLSTLNINYTVNYFMSKGLDANKIVVGIPTYGHSFTLVNSDNPTIGSPAFKYGQLGQSGFVVYPDICQYLQHYSSVINIVRGNDTRVPYFYKGHEWVSYDDMQSVMEKAKFIRENGLRGAMIYCLNSDDYEGVCQTGDVVKFPLAHSVKNTLLGK